MVGLEFLYNSTNGTHWRWRSDVGQWNFTEPIENPCYAQWQGISCNSGCDASFPSNNCYIESIELKEYRLEGTLPTEIILISTLQKLDLSSNRIHGTVPATTVLMTALKYVSLSNNRLKNLLPSVSTWLQHLDLSINFITGNIPSSYVGATSLTSLKLSDNHFVGTIPTYLGNMTRLAHFGFGNNYLTGSLPSQLGELVLLTELDLSLNKFEGTLPTSFSKLVNMQQLRLSENLLSGTFPIEISSMSALSELNLGNNQFRGEISNDFDDNLQLVTLDLSFNSFTGTLPQTLFGLLNLKALYVSQNPLSGTIPSLFGNLTNLALLYARYCDYTGVIPNELSQMGNLFVVDFSSNSLSGTVPESSCQLNSLVTLDFSDNYLSSSLPSCIGSLPALTGLLFEYNMLSGSFPEFVCQNTRMRNIKIERNEFTGTVPSCLGLSLEVLILFTIDHNRFSGTIPSTLMLLTSLESFIITNNYFSGSLVSPEVLPNTIITIDLSGNMFTGSLPVYLFQSPALTVFAAGSNCFSGSISADICEATSLKTLVLNGLSSSNMCTTTIAVSGFKVYFANYVEGVIPSCLFSMDSLQSLYLSGNGMSGALTGIPDSMTITNLSLSYNRLSGTIPLALQRMLGNMRDLDLSNNRLSGTIEQLSFDFGNKRVGNLQLGLSSNRVSGTLPSSLINVSKQEASSAVVLDVLGGNLFACSILDSNILPGDPGTDSYVCGSNDLDVVMLFYSCGFIAICMVVSYTIRVIIKQESKEAKLWYEVVVWMAQYLSWNSNSGSPCMHISRIAHIFSIYRYYSAAIALVAFFVVMPTCLVLKYMDGGVYTQYTYQYGWVVSMGFLEGNAPAIVVGIIVTAILLSALVYFERVRSNSKSKAVMLHSDSHTFKAQTRAVLFIILNFLVVCLVNGAFVGILLYEEVSIQFVATVSVILFKLVWNPAVIIPSCSKLGISNLTTFYILVFNNVIIPILATASVDVSCFQHLILVPSEITDSYLYSICTIYANNTCQLERNQVVTSSIDPPFIYSYQCSSALLKNYVTVYVAMYAFVGLVLPLIRVGCMLYFNECFGIEHGQSTTPHSCWMRSGGLSMHASSIGAKSSLYLRDTEPESCSESSICSGVTTSGNDSYSRKMKYLSVLKERFGFMVPMIRCALPILDAEDLLQKNPYKNSEFENMSTMGQFSVFDEMGDGMEKNICITTNYSAQNVTTENPLVTGRDNELPGNGHTIASKAQSKEGECMCSDASFGPSDMENTHTVLSASVDSLTALHGSASSSCAEDGIDSKSTPDDIEAYFKSSSAMIANTSFYKMQANCLNASVGLVVLFTFGLAYPPLAMIIAMYIALSTLVMQICIHNHYLQVSNICRNSKRYLLARLWNRIVGIEIVELHAILFLTIRPTAAIGACFFCLFFVDMTYGYAVSISVGVVVWGAIGCLVGLETESVKNLKNFLDRWMRTPNIPVTGDIELRGKN